MPFYFYHLTLEAYQSSNLNKSASVTAAIPDSGDRWPLSNDFCILPSTTHSPSNPKSRTLAAQASAFNFIQPPAGLDTSHSDCDKVSHGTTSPAGRQLLRNRATSFPPPSWSAGIGPEAASGDWRFSSLSIKSFDAIHDCSSILPERKTMLADGAAAAGDPDGDALASRRPAPEVGPNLSRLGNATKARFVPLDVKNTDIGWGVVHLYREGDESPELDRAECGDEELDETQCTTLCILAVPIEYDVPKFLDWVGAQWAPHVAHWRLVMTNQWGSYIALLKFRDAKRAKLFREQYEGRLFPDVMRVAHVVYMRSITFKNPHRPDDSTFPDLTHDPFISTSLRPYPPPTADLIELPTCPVCLERMDDTTGLMTIHCQHIFHCNCLQSWKGSGCPVCRYSNNALDPGSPSSPVDPSNPYAQPFGRGANNMCSVCDCTDDLWICLICGRVGCGRYKGGHAKEHYKETAHCFALELETQHVWDYAEDRWVHRLLRNKDDGKIMELPSRGMNSQGSGSQDMDSVPRTKIEAIGLEYSHLLSSQLDSQRIYFEGMLNKAVDKASQATASADRSSQEVKDMKLEMRQIQKDYDTLASETVPQLERDLERERKRAEKSAELARNLSRALQEEKKVSEGLLERIKHTNQEMEMLRSRVERLKVEKSELEEMNRDLAMFISGQEKLKELEESGELDEEEVRDGSVSAPQQQTGEAGSGGGGGRRRRKGRGRGD